MRPGQPLPRLWLITDERADAGLDEALRRLPRGSGVIFRHYAIPAPLRRARFEHVRRITRRRGLVLVLAGPARLARAWQADGCHEVGPGRRSGRALLRTVPVHSKRELRAAERAGADLAILSPVFPTRSHPGGRVLGPVRFGLAAQGARIPVIALGGMTGSRARRLAGLGAHGWAAIDALTSPAQKRKVVPR